MRRSTRWACAALLLALLIAGQAQAQPALPTWSRGWTISCAEIVATGAHPCLPRVYALQQIDERLLVVGGNFDAITVPGGQRYARRNLAVIDLASNSVLDWKLDTDNVVRALLANDDTLYLDC